MNKSKLPNTLFSAVLLMVPLPNLWGQQRVAQPGTVDPRTAVAYEVAGSRAESAALTDQPLAVRTPGMMVVPTSSIVRPEDAGLRWTTSAYESHGVSAADYGVGRRRSCGCDGKAGNCGGCHSDIHVC